MSNLHVVLTNKGNWESDMLGVVGIIDGRTTLLDFIEKHTESHFEIMQDFKVYGTVSECADWLDDHQIDAISTSSPTMMALSSAEPDVAYFIIPFDL